MKLVIILFGTLTTAVLLAEAIVSDYSFNLWKFNAGKNFRLPTNTIIVSVENVTMMTTKAMMELMGHQYVLHFDHTHI